MRDNSSWQAIYHVSKVANKEIMEALLSKGANLNSKNYLFKGGGTTTLIIALQSKKNDFADYLALQHSADIYSQGTSDVIDCFKKDDQWGTCCYLTAIPLTCLQDHFVNIKQIGVQ